MNDRKDTNKTELPCETVRDLFPSYIDGLTGDVTNGLIETHLAGCEQCSSILEAMRSPEAEPSAKTQEGWKVMDFLKKNKRRNMKILIGSLAGAVVLAAGILLMRLFVIGEDLYGDWIACEVQVNGNHLVLDGTPVDSAYCVSKVTFEEKDGVVTARTKAALAGLRHNGHFHAEYTADGEITQIRLNDRILWDNGYIITSLTSAVFQTRHEYMGDVSANARTAAALNLAGYLGNYTNELRTSQEPYTWVIKLSEDIPANGKTSKESTMESLAYVLMGVIRNLNQVSYEYTVNGQPMTKDVTVEDGNIFFWAGVKTCYDNVRYLDELISRTGLSVSPTYPSISWENRDFLNAIAIKTLWDADIDGSGYTMTLYKDGAAFDTHQIIANHLSHDSGMSSFGYSRDSGKGTLEGHKLEAAFTVTASDGKQYPVKERVEIPAVYGSETVVRLKGNPKDGFSAEVTGTHYFNTATDE